MITAGHRPNEVTLHSFLSACVKEARGDLGRALFERLTSAGSSRGAAAVGTPPVSQMTYTLFIKLYARCQLLSEAFAVFEDMTGRQGLEASPAVYGCLLRACVQSRQAGRALEVFSQLKAKVAPALPDGITYRLLIGSCAA